MNNIKLLHQSSISAASLHYWHRWIRKCHALTQTRMQVDGQVPMVVKIIWHQGFRLSFNSRLCCWCISINSSPELSDRSLNPAVLPSCYGTEVVFTDVQVRVSSRLSCGCEAEKLTWGMWMGRAKTLRSRAESQPHFDIRLPIGYSVTSWGRVILLQSQWNANRIGS